MSYLIVGAYALGAHGRSRATNDFFAAAWPNRLQAQFGPHRCPVISAEDQLANKRAAGRPKDLADAEELMRIIAARR